METTDQLTPTNPAQPAPTDPVSPIDQNKPLGALITVIVMIAVIVFIIIATKQLAINQSAPTPTPSSPSETIISPTPATREEQDIKNIEIQDIDPALQDIQNDLNQL